MRLENLFLKIGAKLPEKLKETEITDVAYDSRRVKEGALFVAIKGFKSDGHRFIEQAAAKGAAVIVGEEDLKLDNYVRVPSSRKFLALASAELFGNPAERMKIVGITGTNGKTTTTYLMKCILEKAGKKCGLIGTNQIIIADEALDSERTTPESRELHEYFARMLSKGTEYVIMEVSSHSLDLDRVYGIEFETGVFTNLTQDHLDYHITEENYAKAKAALFTMSRSAAVNADDKYAPLMLKGAKNALTYSIDSEADIKAENVEMNERGICFDVSFKGKRTAMSLAIPGRFSVYNALAACTAAFALGLDGGDIQKGLKAAEGVKGRLEVVPTDTPYTVIIDYAHTPDGVENILKAVRGFAKGRIITLVGCGGDRDKTKRPIMGAIAEELSDIVIVTSDNPRTEKPEAIIEDILAGLKKKNHTVIVNRAEAIGHAMAVAREGDVIVLAGKGHETYQEINGEKIHFDEREIVEEFLKSKR